MHARMERDGSGSAGGGAQTGKPNGRREEEGRAHMQTQNAGSSPGPAYVDGHGDSAPARCGPRMVCKSRAQSRGYGFGTGRVVCERVVVGTVPEEVVVTCRPKE